MSKSFAIILYLGGSTILWLKGIIVIIYCPSCRKLCKKWWPVISGMKHWDMFPTSITIRLHTRGVQRNRNTPCDYTYEACSKSVQPLAKKNTFTLLEVCNPNPLRSSLLVNENTSSSGSAIVRSISGMPLCEWSRAWPPCSV